jgi:hypothetical protein
MRIFDGRPNPRQTLPRFDASPLVERSLTLRNKSGEERSLSGLVPLGVDAIDEVKIILSQNGGSCRTERGSGDLSEFTWIVSISLSDGFTVADWLQIRNRDSEFEIGRLKDGTSFWENGNTMRVKAAGGIQITEDYGMTAELPDTGDLLNGRKVCGGCGGALTKESLDAAKNAAKSELERETYAVNLDTGEIRKRPEEIMLIDTPLIPPPMQFPSYSSPKYNYAKSDAVKADYADRLLIQRFAHRPVQGPDSPDFVSCPGPSPAILTGEPDLKSGFTDAAAVTKADHLALPISSPPMRRAERTSYAVTSSTLNGFQSHLPRLSSLQSPAHPAKPVKQEHGRSDTRPGPPSANPAAPEHLRPAPTAPKQDSFSIRSKDLLLSRDDSQKNSKLRFDGISVPDEPRTSTEEAKSPSISRVRKVKPILSDNPKKKREKRERIKVAISQKRSSNAAFPMERGSPKQQKRQNPKKTGFDELRPGKKAKKPVIKDLNKSGQKKVRPPGPESASAKRGRMNQLFPAQRPVKRESPIGKYAFASRERPKRKKLDLYFFNMLICLFQPEKKRRKISGRAAAGS